MSSLWQKCTPKIRQTPSKTFNSSFPCLTRDNKKLKTKQLSQSIHQTIIPIDVKMLRNKEASIVGNVGLKKQALTQMYSRSMYKLPSKHRNAEDIMVVEIGAALIKIEDVFNEEFRIQQGEGRKVRKTSGERVGFKKLNEFQHTVMETSAKKWAKRQFEQIFRLFERKPFKCMDNTDQVQPRHRKHNSKSSSKASQRQKSEQRLGESLNHQQKQQFIRQTKAFQKAEKHLTLKSYTVKILYHHLNAQLAIQSGAFEHALLSLYYCEYYARKIDFDSYIVPCLILQSQVKQSMYEFDEAVKILKTALEFTVVKRWKEVEMRVLEKVSMVYYYRGNSYMAKHYKRLAETGLQQVELDIYIKEYSKVEELKSLEARIFSSPFEGISKKKHNEKYELDISRDLFLDHGNMILSHHQDVSQMLRSSKTSKIGIKLRKLILQNAQKAEVTKITHPKSKHDCQVLPRFIGFDYPMEHCNQILKSHLSKSRMVMAHKNKGVNFVKTLTFMKSLYRRLTYELMNEGTTDSEYDKENFLGAHR